MAQLIVDAGPLYAMLDRRDASHAWCLEQAKLLPSPMLTCDAVITEVCYLLEEFPSAVQQLADKIKRNKLIPQINTHAHADRIFGLMETYLSVPMSFADACLVVMVEQNPGSVVFTLDRDFTIYRQHRRRVIPLIAPF